VRDLAKEEIPHLNGAQVQAFFTPAENRTDEQKALVAISDELVNELANADAVVIGAPLYNFGIPSTLKAYFDQVARAGVTLVSTSENPAIPKLAISRTF
jgi:FMN-dependent NADH-azoreductase